MIETKFEFFRGDTYVRNFAIFWDKKITNVFFTLKNTSEDKNAIIHKKLNEGINLMDINEDGNIYLLTIDADDTEYLTSNTNYYFDIVVLSENIKQTAIVGTLTLKENYTRKKDEL